MTETGSITLPSGRMQYLTVSEGPPVVLLHGGIIDAATVSWGEVIEPLALDCRVVAPDLPGYGSSDLPEGPLTVADHVDAVEALLDSLELSEPTVVGLSMGGAVGLGLALRRPELVGRLVLIDSYGLGRQLPNGRLSYLLARVQVANRLAVSLFRRSRVLTRLSLSAIVYDLDSLSRAAVDAVYQEVKRPNAGAAFRQFRAGEVTRRGYRTCYREDLPELSVPVRLLHGRHDDVVPLAWARKAAETIPEADLHVIDHCAHWPPREAPGTVVEHVRAAAGVDRE